MNISIGVGSISFSDVKDSVENFFKKITSKVLDKDEDSYEYDGGWKIAKDFVSGNKIKLAADVLGIEISDDDFVLDSSSGALTIENGRNKIIDFSDTHGNTGLYAYVAGDAGVVDGRCFVNFEIIIGAENKSNNLIAGVGGSSLWGGVGFSADILTGNLGIDNFIIGKNEGNDHIANADSNDVIDLHDVTLSDIVATAADGNLIGVAFNTGFVMTVEGKDNVSPIFQLSDGTRYAYNYSNAAWQNA